MILSACIEWLFADGGRPFPERVRAAARAGFDHVEFWGTGDKDLEELQAAIEESGVRVTAFVSEPAGRLVDPATHEAFVEGVARSGALAARLRSKNLIVLSGDARDGVPRDEQRAAVVEALRRAAPVAVAHGVRLLLEPLNTLVDHKGYFLDSTAQGLDIVREVDEPAVGLLYDLYHSTVMGEDTSAVLAGAGELVGHVHIADAPGRHEPGTGAIDWQGRLSALRSTGYTGTLGLEYMPLRDTDSSLELIRGLVS